MVLNDVQRTELSLLTHVANICKKHYLKYYALGGTLLGAVRHKGFIPWDDDIDIAMPRPDYDIFLKVVNQELPPAYHAKTYLDEKESSHPTFICQVQDLNTLVRLDFAEESRGTSVWLDVFPLDAMPSNPLLRSIHKYRLLFERMKIQFSMYEENVHQYRENRPFHERLLMKFREVTRIGHNWDTYNLMVHIERTLRMYDFEQEEYFVNMFGAYKFREMFPKQWFGEGVELPFEDTTIPCPIKYDAVLTQMYGDYMTPPPIERQGDQHRMTVISLNGKNNLEN